MREVVISAACRLPVGRLGGKLRDVSDSVVGEVVIKEVIRRAGIKGEDIEEVIFAHGHYRSGHLPGNSARVISIRAGLPISIPQFTINKHCAGGLRSVSLACQVIKAGDADIILAGGMEHMSQAAFLVPDIRWGRQLGHGLLQDQLILFDPISGLTMGETAEKLAGTFGISREEQDEFAAWSQQKAERAIKEGRFKEEIVPILIPQPKGEPILFDTDEHPRFGTTVEALSRLRPVFKEGRTVTAGNSCGMNDGAAALIVMSKEKARELGIRPLAKIISYASYGVDPSIMGIGPVPATRLALEKAGLRIEDIDLVELNEAFACQSLYFIREIKPDLERLNVNGGAIALGHPISATGAIILTKLLYEMKRRESRYGLATMCVGGGLGTALIVQREDEFNKER